MKDFLDSVGPGFCLAKWTQATIHLGVGLTHSCHHTKAHHIDVEAIKKESPWLEGETLIEAVDYDRKQYNKRKAVMMKKHLEAEQNFF